MVIKGSVLDNYREFYTCKMILEAIKKQKINARHEKHVADGEWEFQGIFEHLFEELGELMWVLGLKDKKRIYEECADLSNMIDMIHFYVRKGY